MRIKLNKSEKIPTTKSTRKWTEVNMFWEMLLFSFSNLVSFIVVEFKNLASVIMGIQFLIIPACQGSHTWIFQ